MCLRLLYIPKGKAIARNALGARSRQLIELTRPGRDEVRRVVVSVLVV